MVAIVILAFLAVVVALLIGVTSGKDRYAEMSEAEFEAEAKRVSSLGAAIMGLQKIFEPKKVEYMMQRDKRVEGDSAKAADRPLDDPPAC